MNTLTKIIQLETETQAFVEATSKPPFLADLGPEKGRMAVDEAQSGPVKKLPVDIEDRLISGGPSGEVSIRILRPQNAPATLPVILYIHGGGWVFGNKNTHDRLIREFAVGVEAAVVFVNYSLSPEAKYPTAIEEAYAVLKWIAEYGLENGLDPERLAVTGDSVGGNMTAAVTIMSKQRGGPIIRQQAMFYPVTDATFNTETSHEFAEGYWLRRDGMQWFWDQYTTDPEERHQPTASPLLATVEQLQGLPPALIMVGQADVLRDEGEAYANKLREAGVRVTAVRFQATIHDFLLLNAIANTAATRGAMTLAINWLRQGFSA